MIMPAGPRLPERTPNPDGGFTEHQHVFGEHQKTLVSRSEGVVRPERRVFFPGGVTEWGSDAGPCFRRRRRQTAPSIVGKYRK